MQGLLLRNFIFLFQNIGAKTAEGKKSHSHFIIVHNCSPSYHSDDNRPKWTRLSPLPLLNIVVFVVVAVVIIVVAVVLGSKRISNLTWKDVHI